MALSTSAVTLCAPGLLSSLQHLQHASGMVAARKLHMDAAAAVAEVPMVLSAPPALPAARPSRWQHVIAQQLLSASPQRLSSTFPPMTMDPAFSSGAAVSKDLVSAISNYTSLTLDERNASLPSLADQLVACAPQLQAEDIASVAVAFARMGVSHTGLASALAAQVTLRMPLCSPEAVAQTAWAFGELQYYNYEFLDQLLEYMKQNYTRFTAPDLARVLWAMGKLGYHHDLVVDMWHELAVKASSQLDCKAMSEVVAAEAISNSGSSDDVTLQNMIADYAAANLSSFDGEDLGKVAYGLARFCYEDAELYDMMAKRAIEIWDTLKPVDVRRIMTAYGDLGHFNRDLLDCISDKWLVAHVDDPELQMPELRLIVRSFNVLGYSNPNIAEAIKQRTCTM